MITHHTPAMNQQVFIFLAKFSAINKNIQILLSCENINPPDSYRDHNSECQKMNFLFFPDPLTTVRHISIWRPDSILA
jgi:hypothetical protein